MQLHTANKGGVLVISFQFGFPIPRGTGFGVQETRVKLAGKKGSDRQLLCLS